MTDAGAHLVFHHVGVACTDIAAEQTRLAGLGYTAEGEPFVDPKQGVRGQFVAGQAPRLELLEPLGTTGVLTPWLAGGVKLYHLAYLADSLEREIATLRAGRAKLVVPPVEAVAFAGRCIAFLMLPNRMLIELIARE